MIRLLSAILSLAAATTMAVGQEPPRCTLEPLPGHQVAFQIDGIEKTRWHYGPEYPRPFFYPLLGPSGVSLTRMGHPGAPNHDHHRSVWLAHHSVNGHDFWSDGKGTLVRQRNWYAYRDGNDEAIMASVCEWLDPAGVPLLEQDLVAALIPLAQSEHALELQVSFRPARDSQVVELGKTNFGFLAVRVAKSLSAHFGQGVLKSSEGLEGEAAIFGKRARWMDYSGLVSVGAGSGRHSVVEGITYFDHPGNLRYPSAWHVRSDGWMGSSLCLQDGLSITQTEPLQLRYLLHAHHGGYDPMGAEAIHQAFADRPGFRITPSPKPHLQFEVGRREK